MNNIVTSATLPKAGTCPHGLPPSACPICSNMGGGGSKKVDFNFKSAPPPMMSWAQCEAIGFFLKGLRRSTENNHNHLQELNISLLQQANKFSHIAMRLEQLVQTLNKNFIGTIISVPIKFILLPAVRVLQNTFKKLVDITDKLAAILGELKKGLEKAKENINKFLKEVKNKIFKLLNIFGTHNQNEDKEQIDEEKKIFNINKFFKIITSKKKQDKNEART